MDWFIGSWGRLFCLLSLTVFLASCSFQKSGVYEKVAPTAYESMIQDRDSVQIIDVRTPPEYRKKHIQGAVNINFLGGDFKRGARQLDTSKPVYIYCQTAHRSPLAARKLRRVGFKKVIDLEGGFKKWSQKGLPGVQEN